MALRYSREDEDAREYALASVFAVDARRFRRVMNALFTERPPSFRQKRFVNYDRNDLDISSLSDNDAVNEAIAK